MATVVLQKGSKGVQVLALQQFLNRYGFTDKNGKKLIEDGEYGDLTKQAVIKFQTKAKALGLYPYSVDGIYGQQSQISAYNYGKSHPIATTSTKTTTTTTVKATDGCMRSPRFISDADIKQDTNYFCACNTVQQVLYELLGIKFKESEIAVIGGTTTSGTDHNGIIKDIKTELAKYGKSANVYFKNMSEIGWQKVGELAQSPTKAVFFHDLYKNKWGHYEYVIGVCMSNKKVIIANSLSGGYIENRDFSVMQQYINGISQPSVGIVELL
ncbi:MAG: peptidoglycan-binding protein [Methanobacterium paludis]|nr:peptidoglycan-binding protein [Methanobacterium paludis]